MRWPLLFCFLLHAPTTGHAQTKETRRFDIAVDGDTAGSYQITFVSGPDGTVSVTHQADVSVRRYLVVSYTYTFSGSELWKDSQLLKWDCSANDNGTRLVTSGRRGTDGIRVTGNGHDRIVRPDIWLNTYSFKPTGQRGGQRQAIVEADSGKELQGLVDWVGAEERSIAGQKQACDHFRVRGEVQVDVWYDGQGRLVHQESVEDGHRTVMKLTQVNR